MPRRHNRRPATHKRYTEPNKIPLAELYIREGGICCICLNHVEFADATREHLIPKAHGGRNGHNFSNIGLSHEACNKLRDQDELYMVS